MAEIATASGRTVDPGELGVTLMHEHAFVLGTEMSLTYPETIGDESELISRVVSEYRELEALGVRSLVDATIIGLGRSVPRLMRVAEQVDLNVIVATGIYTWYEIPHFFRFRGPESLAPDFFDFEDSDFFGNVDDLFVRDIEVGIGDSPIRAGVIKVTTDRFGISDEIARIIRAAASAHRRTGVPIITHTREAPNGLDQQRLLAEHGVDLGRVVIGHVDTAAAAELGYAERLIDAGSFVGFDRWGHADLADSERARCVASLCAKGYAERIVLSNDDAAFFDGARGEQSRPAAGKAHLFEVGLPLLREAGVEEEQITTMLQDNPRRLFETPDQGASA